MRGLALLLLLVGCQVPWTAGRAGSVPTIRRVVLLPLAPTIHPGETLQFAAMLTEGDATLECAPIWQSFDESIMTIEPNGRIRAVGTGNATVTARCGDTLAGTTVYVSPGP